jgi:hypothetical protein
VDIGDKVSKGDSLAVLEVPELQAQLQASKFDMQHGEDAAPAVFGDGEDARSAEGSEGVRRYAAVNEVAASWEESADVLAVSYPQGVVTVAKDDSPWLGGDSSLLAQHFDLTSVGVA